MSARTERARGFTLLEVITAAAVGLVILASAVAAFDLQGQFARNTERLLSAQATAGLGLTMMQRDLENAGLRFRGGVQVDGGVIYAPVVRPLDNLGGTITSLRDDLAGTTNEGAVSSPAAGFIVGTDAFEVLQGAPQATAQRIAASVAGAGAGGAPTRTVTISPSPFVAGELSASGSSAPVLMFWNDDFHCLGRVVGGITVTGTLATAVVQTVDADLIPASTAWPGSCPANFMHVEILEQRRRYLVYQSASNVSLPTINQPARIGLHVQSNAACDPVGLGTVCSTDLGAPLMVAEGVDDMQIAWRVPLPYAPTTGGWCAHGVSEPTCGFDQATWTPAIAQTAAAIYGAQIMLTSRGQEVYRRPGEPIPQLLNHVPAVATDGIVRAVMQNSVLFRNSVTP